MRIQRDLLGRKIRHRRSTLEVALEKYDKHTFQERLSRLRWLSKTYPKGVSYAFLLETAFVFGEVKNTFIDGSYVATVLLCSAFVEHWLYAVLSSRGFAEEARGGLAAMVSCLRREKLAHEYLLARIDKLRKIRNPFVHLKPFDHNYRITQRAVKDFRNPILILEDDAKFAVELMCVVSDKLRPSNTVRRSGQRPNENQGAV